jgi:hypothetical protein
MYLLLTLLSFFPPTEKFEWLTGEWKAADPNSNLHETWIIKDGIPSNRGFLVKNLTDTTLLETVQILRQGKSYYYVPTTMNQNNRKAVYFKMTTIGKNKFVAENSEHDFPQRIHYRINGRKQLEVTIGGKSEGIYRKEDFLFNRVSTTD